MSVSMETSSATVRNTLNNAAKSAQKQIHIATQQVTSGKAHQRNSEIVEDANIDSFINIKTALKGKENKHSNNKLLVGHMTEVENSVRQMHEHISESISLTLRAKDPSNGDLLDVKGLAESKLAEVQRLLNTQFNGKYIFSGSKLNTVPVVDIVTVSNINGSGNPSANYYKGDGNKQSARISDDTTLSYGIEANDVTFQKVIAALHNLIDGKVATDPAKYDTAMDLLNEAKVGVQYLVNKVGDDSSTLLKQIEYDEGVIIRLKENVSEIEDVDELEAISRLLEVQNQLQATLLLNARTQLTLADFL